MSGRRFYAPHRFGADALAIIAQAETICRAYAEQGYDLTLRQLYYQFVARDLIPNTDRSYKNLGSIINDARLAGYLSWDYLVDRTRNVRRNGHWTEPGGIVRDAARSYHTDLWIDQPIRVEVWIEKDALVGVLEPVCDELDVPLFSCRGYTSQSEMWAASQRLRQWIEGTPDDEEGQHVVILHLGDHDPSGIDMTRDIRDRLKLFLRGDWIAECGQEAASSFLAYDTDVEPDSDDWEDWPRKLQDQFAEHVEMYEGHWGDALTVKRIALTREQIDQYQPPPNPAKVTDSRAGAYIAEHGRQSWELDALDPATLSALVRTHVAAHTDHDRMRAQREAMEADREVLTTAARRWPLVAKYLGGKTDG